MTQDAKDFVETWVANNIHATAYEPEGNQTEAREKALAMNGDAVEAGVSWAAVQPYVGGNAEDYMAEKIEAVNDAEVQRLVAKDD